LQGSLTYLEEVRQHLSRLPSINPSSRTLILCGYPNVGKSSFMNRLTNANVEVEPYAFTTKSLYVGHFDHCYSRWQVIDTPGVLDHPMANRNKIEMQAITALAHVHAAVLYFLDISENCGYSLEAQVKLFHEIKVLFQHRPVVVLLNKVDLRSHSDLSAEELQMIRQMADGLPGVEFIPTSNVTAEGLQDAQVKACNALLMSRVEKKTQGKRGQEILDNTLHTVMPSEINVDRPPSIPTSILSQRQVIASGGKIPVRTTEKDLQEIHGGAGVYSMDDRKRYLLAKPEWKYDIMPEILDGRNVSDFVDPDVLDKLRELEKEEEQVLAGLSSEYYEDDPEWVHTQQILMELHEKIGLKKLATHEAKARTLKQRLGFMDTDVQEALGSLGYQTEGILSRAKAHEKFDNVRAFEQELDSSDEEVLTDEERDNIATPEEKQSFVKSVQAAKLKRKRNILQAMRLHGPVGQKARKLKPNRVDRAASTDEQRLKMAQATKRAIKTIGKTGVRGISDRAIQTKMPKHLFSGKRTIGK
ncbi:MAG: uncharacterized protein KVP18_001279, partial [Porospora cf. gigantea A]|uniref:uncharacterized protein n=2 Tax=Porospora cf. gigantea A TaxID=2853593 RepID=UPI00355952FB